MHLEYKLTNREKAMQPKKNKFWCKYCDMALVGEYSKCPVCGKRNGKKRLKNNASGNERL